MRFVFLRIITACAIICIVWHYALPQLSSKNVHFIAMNKSVQQEPHEEAFASGIDDLLHKTGSSSGSRLTLFLLAFFVGILMSFTPCVYPLIPITVGILQKHASPSLSSNFIAACSYVSGISLVRAMLGYIVARTSLIFGQWLGNPWVIGFMILFFLYLAFSLFGFYELYIPSFLRPREGITQERPSLLNIFIFGAISGLVASPCLTPGLAALLAIVAEEKNPLIGFLVMLFFSLGASLLLIIVGTFSNVFALLPRVGKWMKEVERAMGFMILALCVYFLQPIVAMHIIWVLYGIVLCGALGYFIVRIKNSFCKCS